MSCTDHVLLGKSPAKAGKSSRVDAADFGHALDATLEVAGSSPSSSMKDDKLTKSEETA